MFYYFLTEEGFGLSATEIGGILGGSLFLVVAVTLSIIAILCNRRKNRKRRTKYGGCLVLYVDKTSCLSYLCEKLAFWHIFPVF